MPLIWKNKRSETGKRNANLKHYVCVRQKVLPAYALVFLRAKAATAFSAS